MAIEWSTQLTPRESVLMDHDSNEARLNREHAIKMKELEIELHREEHTAELLQKQIEARWASWLKIPIIIVKLPVYILLSIAVIILSVRNREPSARMLDFLKK